MRAEVLIVGAGISGLLVSYLLAREGVDVVQVDSSPGPGRRPHCSGILGMDCWRLLPFRSDGWRLNNIREATFISPKGSSKTIRGDIALVVDRERMEEDLVSEVLSEGVKLSFGSKFIGVSGRKALIKTQSGRTDVGFFIAIGADGSRSKVAHSTLGGYLPLDFGVNMAVRSRTGERYIVRLRRGSYFSWVHPRGDITYVGAVGPTPELAVEWARKEASVVGGEIIKTMCHPIPASIRSRFSSKNIAVLGDAAGQVKPLSRGGVFFSLIAAMNLSREVVRSLEGDHIDLTTYDRRWWKTLGGEVRLGYAVRSFLDNSSEEKIERMFSLVNIESFSELFNTDKQVISLLRSVSPDKLFLEVISSPSAAAKSAAKFLIPWLDVKG